MKVKPYEAEKFLGNLAKGLPKDLRALLIYGPDNGGVRLSAEHAVKNLLPQRNDFNLRSLTSKQCADDKALLTREAGNLSLIGGFLVVRVRGAADNATKAVEHFLASKAEGFVILDASNLTPQSSLRKLAEKSPSLAAIACYSDDPKKVLARVQQRIKQAGASIEREALMAFTQRLGDDRAITENEIDKLLLYMGKEKNIALPDVLAATGDRGSMGLDALADCVSLGEAKKALRYFDRLVSSGNDPVFIINALSRHFQNLRLVISGEGRADQKMMRLSPPIHFTRKERFLRQCQLWTLPQITRAQDSLWDANITLRTSAPSSLCAQTLMSISLRAQALAKRFNR